MSGKLWLYHMFIKFVALRTLKQKHIKQKPFILVVLFMFENV